MTCCLVWLAFYIGIIILLRLYNMTFRMYCHELLYGQMKYFHLLQEYTRFEFMNCWPFTTWVHQIWIYELLTIYYMSIQIWIYELLTIYYMSTQYLDLWTVDNLLHEYSRSEFMNCWQFTTWVLNIWIHELLTIYYISPQYLNLWTVDNLLHEYSISEFMNCWPFTTHKSSISEFMNCWQFTTWVFQIWIYELLTIYYMSTQDLNLWTVDNLLYDYPRSEFMKCWQFTTWVLNIWIHERLTIYYISPQYLNLWTVDNLLHVYSISEFMNCWPFTT